MPLGSESEPYDLIVIGKGSAAAYFLESLPRRYASLSDSRALPLTILVIGEDDNWTARGYTPGAYGQNVNQASAVIAHRTGSTAPTSQAPQDRRDWASQNARILAELASQVVTAAVTNVCEVGSVSLTGRKKFKVSANNRESYFGCRIVIATGAGIESPDKGHPDYHAMPPQVRALAGNPNVMNLDTFMRMPKKDHANKKVAILGPTAGTDAVMQAGTLGYPPERVWWLMRNQVNVGGFLNVYPGQGEGEKAKIASVIEGTKKRILAYVDDATFRVTTADRNQVNVKCTPVGDSPLKTTDFTVDLFVYSTGQTATNTLTAPPETATDKAKGFLDSGLLAKLEPVYDVNQELGEGGNGSAPWQHVTAVQLEGSSSDSGLMIVGAAAFQVSAKVDHNFLQLEYRSLLDHLLQQSGFETAATQSYRELLVVGPLKEMARLSVHDCKSREKAFLLAWRSHLETGLAHYAELEMIERGRAAEAVEDWIRKARHLCYLFVQRTQAAQYLFESDGTAKKSVQQMLNTTHTMPTALQDCRLLAPIAANVSAINASSPKAMAKKTDLNQLDFQVNFLESRTELRTYISAHYPNIPETQAQTFITKVSDRRKTKGNMAFELYEIVDFELELESLEKKGQKASRRAVRT